MSYSDYSSGGDSRGSGYDSEYSGSGSGYSNRSGDSYSYRSRGGSYDSRDSRRGGGGGPRAKPTTSDELHNRYPRSSASLDMLLIGQDRVEKHVPGGSALQGISKSNEITGWKRYFKCCFKPTTNVDIPRPNMPRPRARRGGVSAEAMGAAAQPAAKRTYYPKSSSTIRNIRDAIKSNFLFSGLDPAQRDEVIDAMRELHVKPGDVIIDQGEDGAHYFVVEKGQAEFIISGKGTVGQTKSDQGAFGELALMYQCPRAATVKAVTNMTLWALDRETFRRILMVSSLENRRKYEDFLKDVDILKTLTDGERSSIADVLLPEYWEDGDIIIEEGDIGDRFYIIVQGDVEVSRGGDVVNELSEGDYFGEIALLEDAPRKATLTAINDVTTVSIDGAAFTRLLGPLDEIMQRRMRSYKSRR